MDAATGSGIDPTGDDRTNHAEAELHLRRAVARRDPAFTGDRAMWMSDLAAAQVSAGSVYHDLVAPVMTPVHP